MRLETLAEAVTRLAQAETDATRCEADATVAAKALAAALARHEALLTRRAAVFARIDSLQPLAADVGMLTLRLALNAFGYIATLVTGREVAALPAISGSEEFGS